ncbi:MAG: hypothetical protein A4E35_00362 [Methanoregula sp. PtaU1.Bin051]|nr:MAG: hypothetical protein A4E35_00362 [Methanoregula sp. PtaU1.Bin051]
MAEFYPYLVASLPMLHFSMKPPFSSEQFLERCCPLIPEKDGQVLRSLPHPEDFGETRTRHSLIRQWIAFDTALRNELVKMRAARKRLEPKTYLRPENFTGSLSLPTGMAAILSASPLDAEKALDEARWKALDELATGHYFDLDFLITYAIKLRILERWEKIRRAEGTALLNQALQG